jgi:hypothetical protein
VKTQGWQAAVAITRDVGALGLALFIGVWETVAVPTPDSILIGFAGALLAIPAIPAARNLARGSRDDPVIPPPSSSSSSLLP